MPSATARQDKSVHPPKKTGRQYGNPKPTFAFRPPQDVEAYVNAETGLDSAADPPTRKVELSAFVADVIRFHISVRKELGDEWWEVVKRSGIEKVDPGVVLARLAKQSLKGNKK